MNHNNSKDEMGEFSSVHFMAGTYRDIGIRKRLERKNGAISGFSGQKDYPQFINF